MKKKSSPYSLLSWLARGHINHSEANVQNTHAKQKKKEKKQEETKTEKEKSTRTIPTWLNQSEQ